MYVCLVYHVSAVYMGEGGFALVSNVALLGGREGGSLVVYCLLFGCGRVFGVMLGYGSVVLLPPSVGGSMFRYV